MGSRGRVHDEGCALSHVIGKAEALGSHTLYNCETLPTKSIGESDGFSFSWEDARNVTLPEKGILTYRPEMLREFKVREAFWSSNDAKEKAEMKKYMEALFQKADENDFLERKFLYRKVISHSSSAVDSCFVETQKIARDAYKLSFQK